MQAFAVLAEPPLLLAAERFGRQRFIRWGLLGIATSCAATAIAPAWWVLLVVLALFGPANGVVVQLSQATLVDLNRAHPERAMARWSVMAALGDLGTPLIIAALAALGHGWRTAWLLSGALALGPWLLWPRREVAVEHVADADTPEKVPLRAAAKTPLLWAWLWGVSLCSLLDEPLVAFGAIHLHQRFGLDPAWRSLAVGAWMVGGLFGALMLEHLVRRFSTERLLALFGLLAAGATFAFAFAPTAPLSAAALFAIGVFGSALYPLSKAQAYRLLPGQAGLVVTLESVLMPLELGLPLALGWALDRFGSAPAMALLAVQPVYLATLALTHRR